MKIKLLHKNLAVAGKSIHIEEFKNELSYRFKLNDLGKINYILGIKIEYGNYGIMFIDQKNYLRKLIENFGYQTSKESDILIIKS